jgi:hypothetical protein
MSKPQAGGVRQRLLRIASDATALVGVLERHPQPSGWSVYGEDGIGPALWYTRGCWDIILQRSRDGSGPWVVTVRGNSINTAGRALEVALKAELPRMNGGGA